MVGRTISHYRIVAQLGTGGMGVVYRAEDLRLGRGVALKFVSDDLAHDPAVVQRLRSEARAASALNHPNICTIHDIGEDDGHPFIVMELMTGHTLRDRLASGQLKVHQIVNVGLEIADALDAAHAGGIVHRDIKPGNIFLTDRGHVKILDFGLAKLTARLATSGTTDDARTAAGVTLGTTAYMSPEQATGEELDGRTDLFSLGVVLYECATGRHPFPGKTSAAVLAGILNRAPVAPITLNPELPLRLQDVINNCLEGQGAALPDGGRPARRPQAGETRSRVGTLARRRRRLAPRLVAWRCAPVVVQEFRRCRRSGRGRTAADAVDALGVGGRDGAGPRDGRHGRVVCAVASPAGAAVGDPAAGHVARRSCRREDSAGARESRRSELRCGADPRLGGPVVRASARGGAEDSRAGALDADALRRRDCRDAAAPVDGRPGRGLARARNRPGD
jgi:hypothetical protein